MSLKISNTKEGEPFPIMGHTHSDPAWAAEQAAKLPTLEQMAKIGAQVASEADAKIFNAGYRAAESRYVARIKELEKRLEQITAISSGGADFIRE